MMIRASGILLPIQSLASAFGIGDMGPEAYRFIDFLNQAGQRVWQILPVNPTDAKNGHSPYHSVSAFAYNPLLISPETMVEDGFLEKSGLRDMPVFSAGRIDYEKSGRAKNILFQKAFSRFRADHRFEAFCARNAHWLDDYSLFSALKNRLKSARWYRWPAPIRTRKPDALASASRHLATDIAYIRFLQYLFSVQWNAMQKRCHAKGIRILGDLPIYIPLESADVWAHPDLFKLDKDMRPLAVSGVPPDYFSKTGQRWGHPVFRWKMHQKTGFNWWMRRIRHNLEMFDYLRIDHFRGLVACWEIPAEEKTAENGRWVKAPARKLLGTLFRQIIHPPIIAEDLGYITADVREVRREFDIPGMRVLVFGFDENIAENPNAPHQINQNCVVYTGTHDTNTARGWFEEEANKKARKVVFAYFGRHIKAREFPDELIRTAYMSRARMCITPMQDLLGLGSDARINRPGSQSGNWQWRLAEGQAGAVSAPKLREMTALFGRA